MAKEAVADMPLVRSAPVPEVPRATSILGALLPIICFAASNTFPEFISSTLIVVGKVVSISLPISS